MPRTQTYSRGMREAPIRQKRNESLKWGSPTTPRPDFRRLDSNNPEDDGLSDWKNVQDPRSRQERRQDYVQSRQQQGQQGQGGGFWGNLASGAGNLLGNVANSRFGQQMMHNAANWAGDKIFGTPEGQQQRGFWDTMKGGMQQYMQDRNMQGDYDSMAEGVNNFMHNPGKAINQYGRQAWDSGRDYIDQNGFSNTMGQMYNKGQQFMNDPRGQMQNYGRQAINYGANQAQDFAKSRGYDKDYRKARGMMQQGQRMWNNPAQGGNMNAAMRGIGQVADNIYDRNMPQQGRRRRDPRDEVIGLASMGYAHGGYVGNPDMQQYADQYY